MNEPPLAEEGDEEVAVRRRPALLALLPLLVFLGLAGLLLARLFSGDSSLLPSALIGKPVPVFALGPVEGVARPGLATADLAQGGPTVVNVFASWCVPCRSETPQLRELERRGIRLVGIAYKDKPAATRRFLNEMGDPFARVGADLDGRTAIDFGVYGVPETYVVDGKGVIRAKIVGPLTDDNIASDLLPALARAQAGDARPPA